MAKTFSEISTGNQDSVIDGFEDMLNELDLKDSTIQELKDAFQRVMQTVDKVVDAAYDQGVEDAEDE